MSVATRKHNFAAFLHDRSTPTRPRLIGAETFLGTIDYIFTTCDRLVTTAVRDLCLLNVFLYMCPKPCVSYFLHVRRCTTCRQRRSSASIPTPLFRTPSTHPTTWLCAQTCGCVCFTPACCLSFVLRFIFLSLVLTCQLLTLRKHPQFVDQPMNSMVQRSHQSTSHRRGGPRF